MKKSLFYLIVILVGLLCNFSCSEKTCPTYDSNMRVDNRKRGHDRKSITSDYCEPKNSRIFNSKLSNF